MKKIDYRIAALTLFAIAFSLSSALAQEYRQFTGSNNKIIEAAFLGFDEATQIVKLRLKDGREQNVKLDLFAAESQQWIKTGGKDAGADNPFGDVTGNPASSGNRAPTPQQHAIPRPAVTNQVTEEMKRDGWISIFDGRTFTGWKPNQQHAGFRVQDGCIVGFDRFNHPYYMEELTNFELLIDVKIDRGGNAGVFVKAQWQENDWISTGFELQVNNSHRDQRKTGSLIGGNALITIDKAPHKDDEWFTYHIICKGSTIECRINGNTLYIHDDKKESLPHGERITPQNRRLIQKGYIALQHMEGTPQFKNIFVKKLPD